MTTIASVSILFVNHLGVFPRAGNHGDKGKTDEVKTRYRSEGGSEGGRLTIVNNDHRRHSHPDHACIRGDDDSI